MIEISSEVFSSLKVTGAVMMLKIQGKFKFGFRDDLYLSLISLFVKFWDRGSLLEDYFR